MEDIEQEQNKVKIEFILHRHYYPYLGGGLLQIFYTWNPDKVSNPETIPWVSDAFPLTTVDGKNNKQCPFLSWRFEEVYKENKHYFVVNHLVYLQYFICILFFLHFFIRMPFLQNSSSSFKNSISNFLESVFIISMNVKLFVTSDEKFILLISFSSFLIKRKLNNISKLLVLKLSIKRLPDDYKGF